MDRWLGKYWPPRCLLLALAAALCLKVWPWALSEKAKTYFLRRSGTAHNHLSPSGICPLILRDELQVLHAWDWKTGRRWSIGEVHPLGLIFPICVNGRTKKVAFRTPGREPTIAVVNVEPPGAPQTYTLPRDLNHWDLVMVTSSGKFAAIFDYRPLKSLRILDLATRETTDIKTVYSPINVIGTSDELEILGTVTTQTENPAAIDPAIIDFLTPARWRIDDEGHLVPSEHKPIDVPDNYRPALASISPDGQYYAGLDLEGPVYARSDKLCVREQASGKILDCPPVVATSRDFVFSGDGKYLFLTDANNVHHVFDVAKNSIVASDQHFIRTERLIWSLFALGVALGVTSLILALWEPTFEIAALYYVVAVAFLDSAFIGISLSQKKEMLFVASYACVVAIGAYWASRDRTLWMRLSFGFVGYTIILVAIWVPAWNATAPGDPPRAYPLGILAYAAFFVLLTSAIPASVASKVTGWCVSRTPAQVTTRRFQFGITGLLIATFLTAFILAPMSMWVDVGSRGLVILRLAFVIVFVFFANGFVIMLLTWLWLRQWSQRSGMISIGLVILLAALAGFYLTVRGKLVEENFARVAFGLLFLTYQLAAFSFPMYLARRHGFHWVKASRLPEASVPPEAVAPPGLAR